MNVVNKRSHAPTAQDVYIGRPSILGNPFVIGKDGTREDVIAKYQEWLVDKVKTTPDLRVINAVLSIPEDANLVCWCAPLACHGDIIRKAHKWLKEKTNA